MKSELVITQMLEDSSRQPETVFKFSSEEGILKCTYDQVRQEEAEDVVRAGDCRLP